MVFNEVSMSQGYLLSGPKVISFQQLLYGNWLLSVAVQVIVGPKDKINSVESGSSDSDAVEPTLRGLDKCRHRLAVDEEDQLRGWETDQAPKGLEELARRQGLPEDAEV